MICDRDNTNSVMNSDISKFWTIWPWSIEINCKDISLFIYLYVFLSFVLNKNKLQLLCIKIERTRAFM